MTSTRYNVLFLCTGNSARSIMAESLLNHWGRGFLRGYSAGSFPKGEVHPLALQILQDENLSTVGLRSKSWNEFSGPDAPSLDFIFTVCDNAAGEMCPIWPGMPITAHWGIPDPAAQEGSPVQKIAAFRRAFTALDARIKVFASLPLSSLDRISLQDKLRRIGSDAADRGT